MSGWLCRHGDRVGRAREAGTFRDDDVVSNQAGRIRLNMPHGHKAHEGEAEYQKSCQNASLSFSHAMCTILVARMVQAIRCFATMHGLSLCCPARSAWTDWYTELFSTIRN